MEKLKIPARLDGLRVLDIAPWNGFFSFECIRRGAAEVISLGPDDPDKTGYNKVRQLLEIENCHYIRGSVYDLPSLIQGRFDIVLFLGLIYHLRHPLLVLDKIYDITDGMLFVDSPVIDDVIYDKTLSDDEKQKMRTAAPAFHKLPMVYFAKSNETAEDYNWFMPNIRALEDFVVSSGFTVNHVADDGRGWASLSARKSERNFTVDVEGWNPGVAAAQPKAPANATPQSDAIEHNVGEEARKTLAAKLENGFFRRYMSGEHILDIGYRGYVDNVEPILPQAIGVELDYPGYDGRTLPFPDCSQDAVYNSHCLEHISDFEQAIRDWHRVLKIGGFLVIVVPHQFLYEKRTNMPSRWNADHKRFYTPASLAGEIEKSLPPNSYRLRHLADNDAGYDYTIGPERHAGGCYEIELVIEKIARPAWQLEEPSAAAISPPADDPAPSVGVLPSIVRFARPVARHLPQFAQRPLRKALHLITRT
jgi:SAM-dependent methyltransferase